ncbi:MAG: ATP-binding protein [candidate division KSB1 bacterium]|nr:ATP-binding protein [candidate division KSB1 bacterium]
MVFRKLRTRLIAHIVWIVGTIVLISFTLVYRFHYLSVRDHLQSDAEKAIRIVENTLIAMMKNKTPELLNSVLPQLAQLHHIEMIRIVRPDGKIAYSSSISEIAKTFKPSDFLDFVKSKEDSLFYNFHENNNTYFIKFRKLENKKTCHSCHDPAQSLNGILFVKTSDEMSIHSLKKEYILLGFIAIGLIGFLSLTTYGLFVRSVDNPVQKLRKAMEAIERGDFSVRIDHPVNDELGQLAMGLNSMARKLEWAQKHLIEHHQQQMMQAESLAKMGEMAASLAHEIKNPISGIVFALNSIIREIPKDDKRREIFEEIIKQANRVEQNLEALLSFAKQTQFERKPTDINIIIERILLFIRQQPDMESIEVTSELDRELPDVLADAKQIEQVLLNLIINAVQAMPDGGNLKITTEYMQPAEKLRITIQDTGIGIPKEIQDRVFQPFFTTKEKGTGLGLTLCREIILKHSGNLTFESIPGKGTTFIIELPAGSVERL